MKGWRLHDSTSMECLECANSQRQRTGSFLRGLGEMATGRDYLMGTEFLFGVMKNLDLVVQLYECN